jgi:hypothetical protein
MRLKTALLASVIGLCLVTASRAQAGVPFTWNLSNTVPSLGGGQFTADTMSSTNYLYNLAPPGSNAAESFILQIDGFSDGGTNVTPAGLGSTYGLYLSGDLTVTPSNQYPKINVSLMADPGNLDGTPSATLSGGLGFANTSPTGAADDIPLATGTVVSGSFGIQPNGEPGAHFVETFVPVSAQASAFLDPLGSHLEIEEFLFNTSTSRVAGTLTNGDTYVLVNGGFGTEDLVVPEPPSVLLLGGGLLCLGLARRRNARRIG